MAASDVLLVGSSAAMGEVREQLLELAQHDVPVFLQGESGTGKGAAARFVHRGSARGRGPFVTLSMTMLTPGLELDRFAGHAAGAFTDAKGDMPGALEAAYGGSLLLDELGDATPPVQGILLHVLEDRQIQRQGEHRPRAVDVRFILATNRDLEEAVARGTFRKDLFYRLPSVGVTMPPLREHLDDLPELVAVLLERAAMRYRCAVRPLGRTALDRMAVYAWPGNVRELERTLERWLVQGRLPPAIVGDVGERPGDRRAVQAREALARQGGDKSAAARNLGVSRTTLYRWLGRDDAAHEV